MDEGHVVDVLARPGKISEAHVPLLPYCWNLNGELHQRPDRRGEEAGVLVEARQFLAVALGQFRLVVPGIHLALAAVHEQPDHALGLGGKMRPLRRKRMREPRRSRRFGLAA